jgi:hypothetical protein
MRTETIKIYSFDELSAEAKENAIEGSRTINVDWDWYDPTCEGMKEVGIEIDSFDIYYRNISITIEDSEHTANKVIEDFGEKMEIVKISKQFIKDRDALIKRLGEGNDIAGYSVKEEFIYEYNEEIEYLEEEYRKEVAEEIFTWLRDDYEYLQTDEAVAETLISNDYEFTKDGTIY